jgi:small subunit ribosomal protein S9
MNNPEEWNACIVILRFSECLRKSARGEVTVRSPGTGLITINNQSIEYFEHLQDREQVGCTAGSFIGFNVCLLHLSILIFFLFLVFDEFNPT